MASSKPSAYRLAPWRKQMKRILGILMVTFVLACVTLVYLSISEKMTDAKLRIQLLQEERAEYSRQIADLTTEEGIRTAYKMMEDRAEKAGFMDIDFSDNSQYEFVVVNGYTGAGINTAEKTPDIPLMEVVSLIRPEYTESLQEWLYKRISTGIESYEVTN